MSKDVEKDLLKRIEDLDLHWGLKSGSHMEIDSHYVAEFTQNVGYTNSQAKKDRQYSDMIMRLTNYNAINASMDAVGDKINAFKVDLEGANKDLDLLNKKNRELERVNRALASGNEDALKAILSERGYPEDSLGEMDFTQLYFAVLEEGEGVKMDIEEIKERLDDKAMELQNQLDLINEDLDAISQRIESEPLTAQQKEELETRYNALTNDRDNLSNDFHGFKENLAHESGLSISVIDKLAEMRSPDKVQEAQFKHKEIQENDVLKKASAESTQNHWKSMEEKPTANFSSVDSFDFSGL